jgi:hypothetical protein
VVYKAYFLQKTPFFSKKIFVMQKKIFILFLSSLFFSDLFSQAIGFTYISDRIFKEQADLVGYRFVPNEIEVPKVSAKAGIKAGSYTFGISQGNLFVEGGTMKGMYNINNIDKTEFGFKLNLINARNPAEVGHLKVILNPSNQAEVIIFKKGDKISKETIFHLPIAPENLLKTDEKYFTDKGELLLPKEDSCWGKKIVPFFVIESNPRSQRRITASDSTNIHFIEEKTLIPPKKKKKDDATPEEPKYKYTYKIAVKQHIVYEDGTKEIQNKLYTFKKIIMQPSQAMADLPYQIVFMPDKGDPLTLFLNRNHAASVFEVGTQRFYVRGY